MSRTIFVNLPVHDLTKSIDFFTTLGFRPDRPAAGPATARMIIDDGCSIMLHTEASFRAYAQADITDTAADREVIIGLSADSRAEVDDLVERAVTAGGQSLGDARDQGFLYMRGFRDLDGHQWSFLHLDVSVMGQA
jgi:uncharacterized protein